MLKSLRKEENIEEIKIVLLGDSGCGKSSLLHRYMSDQFLPNADKTISASVVSKVVTFERRPIKLFLWDTAGQDQFQKTLAPIFFKGAAAGIVAFDLTSEESFNNVHLLIEYLEMHAPENMTIGIVGCKNDLKRFRAIPENQGQELADLKSILYMETSAKDGLAVTEFFDQLVNRISKSDNPYLEVYGECELSKEDEFQEIGKTPQKGGAPRFSEVSQGNCCTRASEVSPRYCCIFC